MRVLAIFDGERDRLFPEVPTASELGFDVPIISSPIILFAPNKVDVEIVKGMEAAIAEIAAAPEFVKIIEAKGTVSVYRKGDDAEANLRAMQAAATPVINALKSAGG